MLGSPPHTHLKLSSLHNSIALAAMREIKIIPTTSRSIGTDTEKIMRVMTQSTKGTYVSPMITVKIAMTI